MTNKSGRREAARHRARFAPRGGIGSDRRPAAVREDRGLPRRMVKLQAGR